jgi:transposase
MLFPDNIGPRLSIDEVSLSKGELYTFITNKNGRGKKGSLVASVQGTLSKDIIAVLDKLPLEARKKVKEVTLDMARNMESAVKISFPCADLVTDRFHVVKLVIDALQHVRIKQRWEEIDKENEAIEQAKTRGEKYKPLVLQNGDTPKQLLARSRYILAKKPVQWTPNQKLRAEILFSRYPILKQAYQHTMVFRQIYENTSRSRAAQKLIHWIQQSVKQDIKQFYTAANSVKYNMENILNFFNNRSTNANAESFNSKIKLFRANLRGVTDTAFFLFRLKNLFA